jgi:hypothetical protein
MKLILTAAFVISATAALAQGGEPPRLGDAHPPGALKQGGVPPAAVMRRGDDMAPLVQNDLRSRDVSGRPQGFGNNPTPTRNDPPGTRTQCRGGCQ